MTEHVREQDLALFAEMARLAGRRRAKRRCGC